MSNDKESMKKEAIIDLIKNDLDEMKALVETFREPDRIATDFLDLLKQKHESTGKEILLLKYWSTENLISETPPSLEASVSPVSQPKPISRAHTEPEDCEDVKPQANAKVRITNDTKIEPSRPKIEDYFSAELEGMNDPFEGLTIGSPANGEGDKAEPEMAEDITDEVKQTKSESEIPAKGTETASAKEEVAHRAQDAEVEVLHKEPINEPEVKTQTHPQKAKASAVDIANYGTPVSDVSRAIGINDRFLYQRELFKGNKMAFDAAIETINAASSYEQAYQYLRQSFNWDETDPTVEAFLKAVHRKFL